ncbi:MAG: hypothetical protein ACPGVJ_11650, partial [Mangrovicoccus sp.]
MLRRLAVYLFGFLMLATIGNAAVVNPTYFISHTYSDENIAAWNLPFTTIGLEYEGTVNPDGDGVTVSSVVGVYLDDYFLEETPQISSLSDVILGTPDTTKPLLSQEMTQADFIAVFGGSVAFFFEIGGVLTDTVNDA